MRWLSIFLTELQQQRDKWVLWLPLPVAIGIAAYFSLNSEPPLFMGFTVFAASVVLFGAFYRNRKNLHLWLIVILLTAGFAAAQFRTVMVEAPVLQKKTYPATLRGKIVEVDPLPKAYRIVLEDIEVVGGKIWEKELPKRVRIKLKNNDPAVPNAGDIGEVKAVLLPVSGPVLPDAFDFQRYAFFKKLGATGYAIADLKITKKNEEGFFFENLRRKIRERIEKDVTDKDHAALITAFMVGESNGISERIWEICRKSGIAHLIAISGSHFVMIAGFPFFLIRAFLALFPFIALRWPIKKIAAVCAIATSIFYMFLIGAPIPAQRAVLSVIIVMGAIILDRDPFTLRLASFSALLILLLEPESLTGASFQLSFAAIIGLIAFFEATKEWWSKNFRDENRWRRYSFYLIGCFASTFVASAATAPFALYHFSSIPLLAGWVANMIAVPVTSFITFPMGLLACLLMPLGLEKWPLWLTEKSLGFVMHVAEDAIGWPLSAYHVNAWPVWMLGIAALGGLWLCIWQGRIRYIGIAPVIAVLLCIPFMPRPDVLISDNAKIFALRDQKGKLWISSARVEKFARGEWIEREGGEGFGYWDDEDSPLQCIDEGCFMRLKNHNLSFADESAMIGDEIFIDWENTRKEGAHAVYLDKDGSLEIRTTRDSRGNRPWTSYNASRPRLTAIARP